MAGYRRKPKIYKLRFEDSEMAGLVVMVKPAPVGAILAATRLAGLQDLNFGNGALDSETISILDGIGEIFENFSNALIEWNLLDDDGDPVPATLDGVRGQDAEFIMDIIKVWTDTSGRVSAPLEVPSNAGSSLEVALIPMETYSGSQQS